MLIFEGYDSIQLKSRREKTVATWDSWLQQHMTVTTCTRLQRQTQPIFHSGSGKVRKSLVFAVAIHIDLAMETGR